MSRLQKVKGEEKMLKHTMVRIVLFVVLFCSAFVYVVSTSPTASAAPASISTQTVSVAPDRVQLPPRPYDRGFRDGYRLGFFDGISDCRFHHRHRDHHRRLFPFGPYNRGFRDGYFVGYRDGFRACRFRAHR